MTPESQRPLNSYKTTRDLHPGALGLNAQNPEYVKIDAQSHRGQLPGDQTRGRGSGLGGDIPAPGVQQHLSSPE